jgi:hypothetical protein
MAPSDKDIAEIMKRFNDEWVIPTTNHLMENILKEYDKEELKRNMLAAQETMEREIVKNFDITTVQIVKDPVNPDCRIQDSAEDKFDRAMKGVI